FAPATYTFSPLSLPDALPISRKSAVDVHARTSLVFGSGGGPLDPGPPNPSYHPQQLQNRALRYHARCAGPARRIARDRPSTTARDRKSTRLNSSHVKISYAVF